MEVPSWGRSALAIRGQIDPPFLGYFSLPSRLADLVYSARLGAFSASKLPAESPGHRHVRPKTQSRFRGFHTQPPIISIGSPIVAQHSVSPHASATLGFRPTPVTGNS